MNSIIAVTMPTTAYVLVTSVAILRGVIFAGGSSCPDEYAVEAGLAISLCITSKQELCPGNSSW